MRTQSLYPLSIALVSIALLAIYATFALRAQAEDNRGDEKQFRPIVEADMPEVFPQYTPVEEVQIKDYPAYRKARADAGHGFWTLFTHIKKSDIAMTAPVEMTYSERKRPRESNMAFLYGSSDMGKTGRQGNVEVLDVSPMTVVSTGVRGPRTARAVAEARDRLNDWLAENEDRYAVDGKMRVMAYNSPFVPRSKNYFEVEIPIRSIESADSAEGTEQLGATDE